MELDLSALPAREAYTWMTDLITPRPIAWVSTVDAEGRSNLAPFSFFNGVTASPPTLLFVPVNLRDGAKKDTVLNLEAVPECVVHIVPQALADKMNACAGPAARGERVRGFRHRACAQHQGAPAAGGGGAGGLRVSCASDRAGG